MRILPFRILCTEGCVVINSGRAGGCRAGWGARQDKDDADSVGPSDECEMDCDCEAAMAFSAFTLTALLPMPGREVNVDMVGVDALPFNLSMDARRAEGVMIPIASASRSSSSMLRPKASDAAPIWLEAMLWIDMGLSVLLPEADATEVVLTREVDGTEAEVFKRVVADGGKDAGAQDGLSWSRGLVGLRGEMGDVGGSMVVCER